MKRPVILMLFLLWDLCLFAQGSEAPPAGAKSTRRYEAGVNLFTRELNPSPNDYYSYRGFRRFKNFYAHGLYFKINKGRKAFRFAANYYQSVYETENFGFLAFQSSFAPITNDVHIYRAGEVRAGYQYLFSKRRFSLYYLTDVRVSYAADESTRDCPSCQYQLSFIDYYNQTDTRTFQAGISNGLGLRLQIAKRLVFNLESSLEVMFENRQGGSGSYSYHTLSSTFHALQFSFGVLL